MPTAHKFDAVAHRGDCWTHPENTLAAFQSAIARGADVVEIDVRFSSDGVPIVIHDATLVRCWGVDRAVADMTAAEIAEVRRAGHRIPTLVEVLDLFAGGAVRVMIDLPLADGAAALVELCRRHAAADQVLWCGNRVALAQVRQAWPEAVLYASRGLDELNPTMINVDGTEITTADIAAIHQAGKKISVWTIDSAADMRLLIGAGADSITTNRLDLLLAVRHDLASAAPAENSELSDYLAVAEQLGWAAIRAQRSAGQLSIDTKAGPGDLVTQIDRDVEQVVRAVISDHFGDHVVAGEEFGGGEEAANAEWAWYCDPVDGTSNFANGLHWSSFSLCLAHRGEIVVAVVADPWQSAVSSAVRGGGAFRNGVRLASTARPSLSGALVVTELAGTRAWPGMTELLDGLDQQACCLRVLGSGTLSLLQPALGGVAAAVVDRYQVIDHGASLLICAEAGAEVLDWDGNPFPITAAGAAGGVLTAAPGAAAALLDLLPNHYRR